MNWTICIVKRSASTTITKWKLFRKLFQLSGSRVVRVLKNDNNLINLSSNLQSDKPTIITWLRLMSDKGMSQMFIAFRKVIHQILLFMNLMKEVIHQAIENKLQIALFLFQKILKMYWLIHHSLWIAKINNPANVLEIHRGSCNQAIPTSRQQQKKPLSYLIFQELRVLKTIRKSEWPILLLRSFEVFLHLMLSLWAA